MTGCVTVDAITFFPFCTATHSTTKILGKQTRVEECRLVIVCVLPPFMFDVGWGRRHGVVVCREFSQQNHFFFFPPMCAECRCVFTFQHLFNFISVHCVVRKSSNYLYVKFCITFHFLSSQVLSICDDHL